MGASESLCQLCNEETESFLPCGHLCCTRCRELLTSHNLVRRIADRGLLAESVACSPLCLVCEFPETGPVEAEEDEMLEVIQKYKEYHWEKEFDDARERARQGHRMIDEMLHADEDTALKTIEDARKKRALIEKCKKALLEELEMAEKGHFAGFVREIAVMLAVLCKMQAGVRIVTQGDLLSVRVENVVTRGKLGGAVGGQFCEVTAFGKAVFDPEMRLAVNVRGKDMFVTYVDEDDSEVGSVFKDLLPFAASEDLVLDTETHTVFVHDADNFGKVDLKTMLFTQILEPNKTFGSAEGFHVSGNTYFFDEDGELMSYSIENNTWKYSGVKKEGIFVCPHPLQKDLAIEVMADGCVRILSLVGGSVEKAFEAHWDNEKENPIIFSCTAKNDQFLLVSLCAGQIDVFSSSTGAWSMVDWSMRRTKPFLAFLDPTTTTIFTRADGKNKWTGIPLSLGCMSELNPALCVLCQEQTDCVLECGHRCCPECSTLLRTHMIAKQLTNNGELGDAEIPTLCLQCEFPCADVAFNLQPVRTRAEECYVPDWEEQYDAATRRTIEHFADVTDKKRNDAEVSTRIIDSALEKRHVVERRKEDALYILWDEFTLACRAHYPGFVRDIETCVKKLLTQTVEVYVAIEQRSVNLKVIDYGDPGVVWNGNAASWEVGAEQSLSTLVDVQKSSGVVFDSKRKLFVWTPLVDGSARIVCVARWTPSGVEKLQNVRLPFESRKAPFFDQERYVYFLEKGRNGKGNKSCRLDLETMTVDEFAPAPHNFGLNTDALHFQGHIVAFDGRRLGMELCCVDNIWSASALRLEGVKMLRHPWRDDSVVELMASGRVREMRITGTPSVIREYFSSYGSISGKPTVLLMPAPRSQFFLLVCDAMFREKWRVFSSASDSWEEVEWPVTPSLARTAFFDESTTTVYYHDDSADTWIAIRLSNF